MRDSMKKFIRTSGTSLATHIKYSSKDNAWYSFFSKSLVVLLIFKYFQCFFSMSTYHNTRERGRLAESTVAKVIVLDIRIRILSQAIINLPPENLSYIGSICISSTRRFLVKNFYHFVRWFLSDNFYQMIFRCNCLQFGLKAIICILMIILF